MIETTKFDAGKYLRDVAGSPQEIATLAFEDIQQYPVDQRAACIAMVIGEALKKHGMADAAAKTGLARQALYRSFGKDGNPTLSTLLAVLDILGIELIARVK